MFRLFRSRAKIGAALAQPRLQEQVQAMKHEALARAKEAITSGREKAAYDNKPGLSHYIRAMQQVCIEYGIQLPARSILDLSGLTIDGFAFTEDDFAIAQEEINRFATANGHQEHA
jgi:hypothetical protein